MSLVFCTCVLYMYGHPPEFAHGEMCSSCTSWEQHLFELLFGCQVHRAMLQPQGVPVNSKLHIKFHIAEKHLQQPDRGVEEESEV